MSRSWNQTKWRLEPAPVWDASITGLTCYITTLAPSCWLFVYLFIGKAELERKEESPRGMFCLLVLSLWQQLGLGIPMPGASSRPPMWVTRGQVLEPASAAFPGTLTECCITSGVAKAWTSTQMGCQCHRQPDALCHITPMFILIAHWSHKMTPKKMGNGRLFLPNNELSQHLWPT